MIDILVPVASYPTYLEAALSSIRNQHCDNFINVYVIENNTQDSASSRLIKELAAKYKCNYIFFEIRLPQIANFNRCLDLGESSWIHFLHDDDIWPYCYLDNLLAFLTDKSLVISGLEFVDSSFELPVENLLARADEVHSSHEQLLSFLMLEAVHMSATLFKRNSVRFDPLLTFSADQDFVRRYVLGLNRQDIVILNGNNIKNRVGNHSISSMQNVMGQNAADHYRMNNYTFPHLFGVPNFSIRKLVNQLLTSSNDKQVARILSSWSPSWPLNKTLETYGHYLRNPSTDFTSLLHLLARIFLQKAVWKAKSIARQPPKF